MVLERDFELFFPVFSHTYELYSLTTIANWRQRCRKAACFINEVWSDMMPEYLFELLSAFDHIFIGYRHSIKDVARLTGVPCTYLPLAVDVPRFAPASCDQPRPIEVCNIGRRSPVTHQALLDDAERRESFYYYDTVAARGADLKDRTFRVDSPHEHRRMLATLLKRSRYFIANRSYVNRPEFTAGRDEISSRFYEGAAAGAVMIGEAPRTEEFKQQFDWPDAVIDTPFNSPDIGRILADLTGDPARLRAIWPTIFGRPQEGTTGYIGYRWCSTPSAWRRPRKCGLARNGSTGSRHKQRRTSPRAKATPKNYRFMFEFCGEIV